MCVRISQCVIFVDYACLYNAAFAFQFTAVYILTLLSIYLHHARWQRASMSMFAAMSKMSELL